MDLLERIEWLCFGGVIGFVLGYIVGKLHDIKEELDEVDHDLKKLRDERGSLTSKSAANVALFFVVIITLYAALLSQTASNETNKTSSTISDIQNAQKQNLDCTTQVLFDAIAALNERTLYSTAQADSNIELIDNQLVFLKKGLVQPPLTKAEALASYKSYVNKVTVFLELVKKTKSKQILNPFPTVEDLTSCLAQTEAETKEPSQ